MTKKRILLVDHPFTKREDRGSAYLQRKGHETAWCSPGQGDSLPAAGDFDALIVYGGIEMLSTDLDKPEYPYLRQEVDFVEKWLGADKPFLGICLGSQIMARALGASVAPREDGRYELGFVRIEPTPAGRDFLPEPLHMYHWHREGFALPDGAEHLASSSDFPHQAMRYGRHAFGIQFHPEVAPETFARWLEANPDFIERPGAQPLDKQIADGQRYDAAMNAWFEDFLDGWIGD